MVSALCCAVNFANTLFAGFSDLRVTAAAQPSLRHMANFDPLRPESSLSKLAADIRYALGKDGFYAVTFTNDAAPEHRRAARAAFSEAVIELQRIGLWAQIDSTDERLRVE